MFSKLTFAVVSFFAFSQVAEAIALPDGSSGSTTTVNQCDVGEVQCCNSVQSANDPALQELLGLIGVALPNIDALVGLTCNPISVIGAGGNDCNVQPVCCSNNDFNGLVNLGCSPVNLNL